MEKYQIIITKGRVSTSDFGYGFMSWGTNLFMMAVGLWGIYYVNTKWELDGNNILFGNMTTIFLTIFSAYLLYQTWRKLKVTFYPDKRTIESKERIIQQLKKENHWRLEKSDKNYYLFYENNIIIQSYYITIVYDEKGFYLNCYPSLDRVFDLGRSQRWADDLFEDIKGCQ